MSTREHVLEALRDAGAAGVSGESLARMLGVSRVAVGKHVATLRELGYEISAERGSGYRLDAIPDVPLPAEVRRLVRNPFWNRFEGGIETGSTNDDARELAVAGTEEGAVVLAAVQHAGRGRLGRQWESPQGGAYISVLLRPPVAPAEAGSLGLAIAVGVARGLESLGVCPSVKWPNDLRLAEGKLAGVLLEMSAESDQVTWIVAGIGLNVTRPARSAEGAAYLSDLVPDIGSARAAAAALDGVAAEYAVWLDQGFEGVRDAFIERSALTGQQVVVSDMLGNVRAQGVAEGVDDEGRLLVRGRSGVEAVAAGEVTLRRS